MIIGKGFSLGAGDCGTLNTFIRDPNGVWSMIYQEFPGSGSEYPLPPGETVVIATDAIDHSQVVEGYQDLREVADFEFHGESDVDNPDVPNMINHRPSTCAKCVGHGFTTHDPAVYFLSRPVDVEGLPSQRLKFDDPHERFPADRLADVAVYDVPSPNFSYDFCPHWVHPKFNRVRKWELEDRDDKHLFSLQRPVVGTRPNGQPILLDTNTSAVDLELMSRTPGELPPRQ